ncbi:MAG: hypothetical protein P9M14_05375 [Candidatus Alcyoniella australis]|nr:hypothetical protein [Candidatus Alcyoniella australis]
MPRLGAYAETMPLDELSHRRTLEIVQRYNLTVAYAVPLPLEPIAVDDRFWNGIRRWIDTFNQRGGRALLWPLLPKDHGYWLNERNARRFAESMSRLLDWFDNCKADLPGVVYDVETPWQQMSAMLDPQTCGLSKAAELLKFALENRNPRRFAGASQEIERMVRAVAQRCETNYVAVFPLLLADLLVEGYRLQDLLEMPIFSVDYRNYNLMMYTSYLGDLMGNLLDRRGVTRMVFEQSRLLRERFGDHGQITLGSNYEAVLPGKPLRTYGGPEDMRCDVAAAKAAGIKEFWLYCLEGVLYSDGAGTRRRSERDARAWFEMLIEAQPAEPEPSRRYTWLRNVASVLNRDPIGKRLVARNLESD